jgi:16S rRNA (adenine1518-N6/adenine1519-N6)-dimethyltransferase
MTLNGGASFRPKKSLGQNFLIDPVHRARIVAAGELTRADAVLEIGAGDGSLTALIAAQAGRVVAVELDHRWIAALEERFRLQPHVSVIAGDILEMELGELMSVLGDPLASETVLDNGAGARFKVIANLPYYITANVIRKLLESGNPPSLLVLTVQREVAERIVSVPPHMSLLAVSVQLYCTAQVVDHIPAGAFYPPPKVNSAVLRLVRRRAPLFPELKVEDFFEVVRAGFSQPRKQLRNSLSAGLRVSPVQAAGWLLAAQVSPQRRAETLTLQEWGRLSESVTRGAQRN